MKDKLSQMAYWVSECQKCAEHHGYSCDECPERNLCLRTQLQIKSLLTPIPEEKLKKFVTKWEILRSWYGHSIRELLKEYDELKES